MRTETLTATSTAWPAGRPEVGQKFRRTRKVSSDEIESLVALRGQGWRERQSRDEQALVQSGATSAILDALVAESLPGPGTVVLSVDWSFRGPVRAGEEITGEVEVLDVRHDKPITHLRVKLEHEDGTVALDGEALCYTMPLKPKRI